MKRLFYLLCSVLFISSCSNNETSLVDGDELYPVEFSMMATDVVDFPGNARFGQTTTDASIIKSYFLYVYNSTGVLVKEQKNESANTAAPTVKMNLPAGSYTAVLVAFNDEDGTVTTNTTNLTSSYLFTQQRRSITVAEAWECWITHDFYFNNPYYNDYFYKKSTFTVSAAGSVVELIAPRVTGRLHLTYKDANTGDGAYTYDFVRVKFDNLAYGVNFNTDGYKESKHNDYLYLTKSQWRSYGSKAMVLNCMASASPKITLEFCKSASTGYITETDLTSATVLYTRTIEGFSAFQNKITKLTGNVFDNSTFEISINTDWDGEVTGEF